LIAVILNVGRGRDPAPEPILVKGLQVAWTRRETVELNDDDAQGGSKRRLTLLWAKGTAAQPAQPGTLDIFFGNNLQRMATWSVFEYDNVNASPLKALVQSRGGTSNNSPLTLQLGPISNGLHTTATAIAAASSAVNAPELAVIDKVPETPTGEDFALFTHDRTGQNSTVTWTWTGNSKAAAVAVQIDTATPPSLESPEDLARRFEPILYFHEAEQDFPSDPKRYLEQCALWRAESPRNKKQSWGGKGNPFPRAPLIEHGKIAARQNETGPGQSFLGATGMGFLTQSASETRFLELGGWRNKAGNAEPEVTEASENAFANRQSVRDQYSPPDSVLSDSRFWYWVEHFDAAALRTVANVAAASGRQSGLTSVFSGLSNPFALCYYLFFPVHEEPLGAGCSNVEAKEFRTCVGEWACVSVLASTSTTGAVTPRYFGFTGRRPTSSGGAYPPHAFDRLERVVMKAAPWTSVTTNDLGQHPKLYVAKGTHSLYLEPGPTSTGGKVEVDPYPVPSDNCGEYNPVGPEGPPVATLVKILVIPFGFVWAAIEALQEPFEGIRFADPVAPDVVPTLDKLGTVIRPKGLSISPGGDFTDWRTDNLTSGTRSYGFMVDRTSQIWWPSINQTTGFRGRWGPIVDPDRGSDREGMVFPDFCAMFLDAIAKIPKP
jgi:hypothetical protein